MTALPEKSPYLDEDVPPLVAVAFATQEMRAYGEARDWAIRAAHAQGESLRTIAQAAGLSHEQVRRILAR